MNKKQIGYILYVIGAVWAICLLGLDNSYWYGLQNIFAFCVAAVFGIVGTIFVVAK